MASADNHLIALLSRRDRLRLLGISRSGQLELGSLRDRAGLEAAACGCYRPHRQTYAQVLA